MEDALIYLSKECRRAKLLQTVEMTHRPLVFTDGSETCGVLSVCIAAGVLSTLPGAASTVHGLNCSI